MSTVNSTVPVLESEFCRAPLQIKLCQPEWQSNWASVQSPFPFLWACEPLSTGCLYRKHLATCRCLRLRRSLQVLFRITRKKWAFLRYNSTRVSEGNASRFSSSLYREPEWSGSGADFCIRGVRKHRLGSQGSFHPTSQYHGAERASCWKKVSSLIPHYSLSFHSYLTSAIWKAIIPACLVVKWMKCSSPPMLWPLWWLWIKLMTINYRGVAGYCQRSDKMWWQLIEHV